MPEIVLRRAIWAEGHRYRLNAKLPGKPDLIFPAKRLAVFVDGCFWHSCPEHSTMPKTNESFWRNKLKRTIERDQEVNAALHDLGWKVIRVWEHQIKGNLEDVIDIISEKLRVG